MCSMIIEIVHCVKHYVLYIYNVIIQTMEQRIAERGYTTVYIKTDSVLVEACRLYQSAGYQPMVSVDALCDQRLYKRLSSTSQQ